MEITAQNAIYLGEETGGKGRQFKARFLVPGLVKYDYGVCLLTKENADKFIQGFTGCPVIINHQTVTDKNVKDIAVGDIFSVWFDEKDGYYWCNGILRDKEAIKLINEGYSVSCQYLITEYSDNTSGALHNGNPYDKVIENGKPEHLAIVNNPRYEGAIIAVNALLAENEDKWITIHPNGEENKGRHLLLRDGESPAEAVRRVYGDRNQTTLFDTKEYKKTKEDFKKEKEEKQKEYDKIEERHKDSVKQEQEAGERKKNKAIQDYIDGEITPEELEKIVPGMPFNEWLDLADKRLDKMGKQSQKPSDKEEKKDEKNQYLKKGDLETDKIYKLGNLYVKPFVDDDGDLAFYDRTGAWGEGSVAQKFLKSDLKNLERVEKYDKLTDKELKFLSEKGDFKKDKGEETKVLDKVNTGSIYKNKTWREIFEKRLNPNESKSWWIEKVNKPGEGLLADDVFSHYQLRAEEGNKTKIPSELNDYIEEKFDTSEKYIYNPRKKEKNKASNSFVSQFKDTLYTVLAEEIYNRLGE